MKQQILEAKVKLLQDALSDAAAALITINGNLSAVPPKAWLQGYVNAAKDKCVKALGDSRV